MEKTCSVCTHILDYPHCCSHSLTDSVNLNPFCDNFSSVNNSDDILSVYVLSYNCDGDYETIIFSDKNRAIEVGQSIYNEHIENIESFYYLNIREVSINKEDFDFMKKCCDLVSEMYIELLQGNIIKDYL